MRKLIVGSKARLERAVTEYELRRDYVRLHRDIYVPKGYSPDLVDRIDGAWLRSGRKGVVAGVAASALHGAAWSAAAVEAQPLVATADSAQRRGEPVVGDRLTRTPARQRQPRPRGVNCADLELRGASPSI